MSVETDTVWDFIRSAANMILLSPFRLMQEVSKKIVYIPKRSIEKMLFLAVFIGMGFTVVDSGICYFKGTFDLLSGTFPVICMLIGTVILIILYCWYSSVKDAIYEQMQSDLIQRTKKHKAKKVTKEDTLDKPNSIDGVESAVPDNPISEQVVSEEPELDLQQEAAQSVALERSAPELEIDELALDEALLDLTEGTDAVSSASDWLKENDTYVAPANSDIKQFKDVADYQNRIKNSISELEEYSAKCQTFSEAEVDLLQKKLNSLSDSTQYFGKPFVDRFNNQLVIDEELSLQTPVDDIPEDFSLCS